MVLVAFSVSASVLGQWTQWGGPQRDFTAPSGALSLDWPDSGPAELWSRELGDGFSSILYDQGTLYTMYRRGDEEVVVAIDAANGESLWETSYVSPLDREGMILDFGGGTDQHAVDEPIFCAPGIMSFLWMRPATLGWQRRLPSC